MRPVLLELGPFRLYGYGAMLIVGGLLSLGWLRTRATQAGLKDDDDFWLLVNAILLGGFVGGRLFFALVYAGPMSLEFWRALISTSGNFTILGAFAGVPLSVWLFCRWRGIAPARVFDHLGVVAPLWHAPGRLGCFLAGCCYGKPTTKPWGVVFRDPRAPIPRALLGVPLHPTQLYEAFGNALIAAALYQLLKRTQGARPGLVAAAYLAAYGAERFALEFYRGDTVPGVLGLTAGQGLCLGLFGASGTVLAWRQWCFRPS